MGWWSAGRRHVVLPDSERNVLRALVRGARYELIPLNSSRDKAGALPTGSMVTVTASPTHGIEATLMLAEWLASRGARRRSAPLGAHDSRPGVPGRPACSCARAAGLHEAFVVGGDAKQHTEFRDGLGLLHAMQEMRIFRPHGVPAYPEGHSDIPNDMLLRSLTEKQHYAHSMTTQMSFNPKAVSVWISRMRAEGVRLIVHLGVPGATELSKLMTDCRANRPRRFGAIPQKNRRMVGHLMNPGAFGPDAFLGALAGTIADPVARVSGVHLFTFNQVEETAAWQQRMKSA